ncbi:MAG: anion permease [Candidatus Latescibacteria bacterium]|nr:anion permease [Candidatus Latescibacterota bacterium]
MIIIILVTSCYVGWNIGANDTANCIGTSVGSGLLTYKRAVYLVAIFAIVGALLQGQPVMETIGKGVVTDTLPRLAILVAMLSAGVFVTLATTLKLPVSTSQAIVGAIAGVGVATGATVDFSKITTIVACWVICPLLTAVLSFTLYHLSSLPARKLTNIRLWSRILGSLVVLSACYMAFSLGANHVGTAMGSVANIIGSSRWLTVLGGVALASGLLSYGRGVTETVARGITPLDPLSAFAAQTSAAMTVHFFSILGIPVSTSQAIVGAVVGVGLVRGMRAVSKRRLMDIIVGWIATPTVAGLVSFSLSKLLL